MKIFKMMLCAVALVALTACGSGYNKDKAKEYADKINKDANVSFNDNEVAELIDIWVAGNKEMYSQAGDTIGKPEEKKKLDENNDFKIMSENVSTINRHLSGLKSNKKLSNDNLKKYNEADKKIKLMANEHAKKEIEKSTEYDWNKKN